MILKFIFIKFHKIKKNKIILLNWLYLKKAMEIGSAMLNGMTKYYGKLIKIQNNLY